MDETNSILAAMGEAVCVIEEGFALQYVNPAMVRTFGEPGGRRCYEYIAGGTEPCADCPMERARAGETVRTEWVCPRDGNTYEVYAAPLEFHSGRPAALIVLHDISRLKKAERDVARLNRLLATLSDTNQMIVRATDRQQLFEGVCEIAVTRGGFMLASIGMLEEGGIRIRAAARRGAGGEAVDHMALAGDDRPPEGGPTGIAISTGQPRICNDLATDPDVAGWRDQLLSRGFGSFAAFPIFEDGKAVGTLRLHESKPGFFGEEEIALLAEMAGDISFALESMRRAEALQESESRFHAIFEQTRLGVAVTGLDDKHLDCNAAFLDMLGLTKEEFLRMDQAEFTHPEDRIPDPTMWLELLDGKRTSYQRETRYLHKDGGTVWARLTVSLVPNAQGQPTAVIAVVEDVTERKLAESRLAESEQRYRDLVETTSDWVWEVDANGVYTYASPTVRGILGYAPEQVLGKTPFDLMPPEEAARVGAIFGEIAARQEPFSHLENDNLHADGHVVTLETSGTPIFDASGVFCGYRGMDRDISKRKRAEAALQQALAFRDRIIASSMDAFFILAPGGVIEEANEAFAQMLGHSRDELLTMTISDVEVVESLADTEAHLRQIVAEGSDRFETQHRRKDGSIADVEISSVYVETDLGPRFAVFARDITERKAAEARQARLTALLRAVVAMTDELIDAPDVDTLCRRAVELSRERLGLERCSIHLLEGEELRGTYGTNREGLTTDEREIRFACPGRLEGLMVSRSAQRRPWAVRSAPLSDYGPEGRSAGAVGWLAETLIEADRDVVGLFANDTAGSGRELELEQQEAVAILCSLLGHMIRNKRADERIAESERRYRSLFESSPVAILEVDLSGMRDCIETFRRQGMADPKAYLDAHPEAIVEVAARAKVVGINKGVLDLYRAETKEELFAGFSAAHAEGVYQVMRGLFVALAEGRMSADVEGRGKALTGEDIHVEVRAQVVPGHEENLSRVLVSALDITARKKAEDALRQSVAKYRGVFENTGTATVLYGEDGIVRLCNSNFEALSGLPWDQIEGRMDWRHFVAPGDLDAVVTKQAAARDSGKPVEVEFRFVDTDHNVRDVLARVSLIPGSSDYVASLLDITDRKHAADAQRLAAIGQLAAGVAHDFNNLLAAMSMSAELADISGDAKDYEKVVEIVLRSSQRGADLCRNLMAFARPRQPRREPAYLEAVAEAALSVVARQLETTGVTVRREYEPDSHRIMADPGQLEQVFLNLFINACHAMPDGGQLSVETRYAAGEPESSGSATVIVRDTGTGILPEHLGRIFEPFFTTKGRLGESDTPGTGLGLSVSHGIVQAHEGAVRVSSEVGVGTAFELTFPLRSPGVHEPTVEASEALLEADAMSSADAHVLLVDDEEDIRAVVRATLVRAGMGVTVVQHPAEAIAALRARTFDLVISDLSMPGGGGKAVLEAAQELEVPPPVIMLTGRLEAYVVEELVALGAAECLQKPVSREAILAAVARVLEAGAGQQNETPQG